ncbi:hypothetical protein AGOR_G00112850 [Albula goreensis]|uniref:Pre-rRNA-processing protein Ipi1 N-terminal domain-containing protein n=1 Tax=Albula goreensis TaxID=1534307 RepID=A0A8T3DD44_9TELE|nr:hypothetical protein AGOR_G00112850 [Albula goreensis]
MTKKRKRQDDFQKVKLKVGKRKPKADNATDVNFRTKGIRLPEQLKKDGAGPTTHRHLNIKDLLSQLHHYSGGVKQGALVGLRELLSLHPHLLEQHLSSVLSEVAAVFTDKDATVRAAAVRLLRFVAQCVPAERVAPFFPLLSAHLTCAMTHIVEGIQEDALRVLDVLLEHYPALLSARCTVLLRNFLELISQRRLSRAGKGSEERKVGNWALSVTPSRTITAQQWRLTVLTRLGCFLQAVVEERPTEERGALGDFLDREEKGHGTVTPVDLTWEEHTFRKDGLQVYENSGAQPAAPSSFRLRPEIEPGAGVAEGLVSVETVRGFAATLVPLLLEVWVEASTSEQGKTDSAHLLAPESMTLMYQVLTILQLLRRLTPERHQKEDLDAWFRSNYLNDFKHHFMKNFPYGLLEVAKHKKKGEMKRTKQQQQGAAGGVASVEPMALNITLCQVMVSLSSRPQGGEDADWLGPIRGFVRETLSSGVRLSSRHLAALLEVVWRLVLTHRNRAVTEELLQAVNVQYQQRNLTLPVRMLLLRFFSHLYLQEHQAQQHIGRSKVLSRWLAALPLQLVQLGSRNPHLSAQLLQTVQAAAAWRNKDLLHSLQTYACRLYDPQEGSVVLLPAESQQRLVELVYFLPVLPPELLSCLSRCCTAGRVSANLAASLVRLVHIRSSLCGWSAGRQEVAVSDVDYFSFLFSTLTGFSSDKLAALQHAGEDTVLPPTPLAPLSVYPTQPEQFNHHWVIVEEVCHCLETIGSRSQCFDVLQNAICKNLTGLQVVPDSMAAALLRVVSRLLDLSFLPNEVLLRFLSDCCLSLLSLLEQEQGVPDSAEKSEAVRGVCLAALSGVPRLLRLVLQSLHVSDLCEEEFSQLAQMLSYLLRQSQLRNHMLANAALLQHIIQDLTRYCQGEAQEQWLTDLLYCYSVTLSTHRGNLGIRDVY